MRYRTLLFCLLFVAIQGSAQSRFTYSPEHPKAGDRITVTYEPAGALAGTMKPVEGVVYFSGRRQSAEDLPLTRAGKSYSGTIKTDTAQDLVYLGFNADGQWDTNNGDGYYILLWDGDKATQGAYADLSRYYEYFGTQVGLERDYAKALTTFEKELELYPQSRKENLVPYAYLINNAKKSEGAPLIQKEIETLLSNSLAKEEDYSTLATLYNVARLPQQARLMASLRKEKYPNGRWIIEETLDSFYRERDPEKGEKIAGYILDKAKTDSMWKYTGSFAENFNSQLLFRYAQKKDWAGLKKAVADKGVTNKDQIAFLYNNIAWEMQQDSAADFKMAEELSRFATQHAKSELKKPSGKKPDNVTAKGWAKQRNDTYTMFGDTYAMVLYRMGDYKNAYKYAKEAAITLGGGNEVNKLNTYALIAEKVLPQKQYKEELEGFVKKGLVSSGISDVLKRAYEKEKSSAAGFDAYMAALQTEAMARRLEELKKSMLNQTAPSFTLLDLSGHKVASSDLKGKTVVVDFWATWCGPCKASFPGMQKMVAKYKDNPAVTFLFVDTWERGEEKKKNAGDFITANKYDFQVLLDDDNKVVEQFGVEGIPTKFVIGKDGVIRFKAVGFDGSDDKLVAELTAMIELASGNGAAQKAF